MTAKQRAARAKFKAVVAEAKKLRKKNPKLTQAQAVKQAFAINYDKAGKKKIGYSKARQTVNKNATAWLKNRKYTGKDEGESKKQKIEKAYLLAPYGKPQRAIGKIKKKAATKVKAKKRKSTEMHTDTKSHNVNIKVVSGIKRNTGYIGRAIIKTFNLSELKKLNPIYFGKGNDKMFGVYARKLMVSPKLQSQVMIEAQKNIFGGQVFRQYMVRTITPDGQIINPKRFDTIFGAADYIGKNIII